MSAEHPCWRHLAQPEKQPNSDGHKQLITHRTWPGKLQTHNTKVKYQEAVLTSRKDLLSDILQLLGFFSDVKISVYQKESRDSTSPTSFLWMKKGSEIFPVEEKVEKRGDGFAQQAKQEAIREINIWVKIFSKPNPLHLLREKQLGNSHFAWLPTRSAAKIVNQLFTFNHSWRPCTAGLFGFFNAKKKNIKSHPSRPKRHQQDNFYCIVLVAQLFPNH